MKATMSRRFPWRLSPYAVMALMALLATAPAAHTASGGAVDEDRSCEGLLAYSACAELRLSIFPGAFGEPPAVRAYAAGMSSLLAGKVVAPIEVTTTSRGVARRQRFEVTCSWAAFDPDRSCAATGELRVGSCHIGTEHICAVWGWPDVVEARGHAETRLIAGPIGLSRASTRTLFVRRPPAPF